MFHKCLVALATFASLFVVGSARALTTPKLTLVVPKKGDASLRWNFRGNDRKDAVTVEIQHTLNDGGWTPWRSIGGAKRKQTVAVGTLASGTHAWRARAVDSDETTAWSANVGLTVAAPPAAPGPDDPPLAAGESECPSGWVAEVLRLANEERRSAGVAALANHPALAKAARRRAIDMAASGKLSHDGWTTIIRLFGYLGGLLGENIASGYASPAAVMSGWMGSSGHRANLLRSGYRDSGIGCVLDARRRPWWAHDFGG
ncbi:MAG: CAP domain-containing protein [bacterium]|nr:CAP domain-containing protein [bacterium]